MVNPRDIAGNAAEEEEVVFVSPLLEQSDIPSDTTTGQTKGSNALNSTQAVQRGRGILVYLLIFSPSFFPWLKNWLSSGYPERRLAL